MTALLAAGSGRCTGGTFWPPWGYRPWRGRRACWGWAGRRRPPLPVAAAPRGICVAQLNHWSYTGIGWQAGIESSVLSVIDSMEMADRPPYVKTCIDMDARAYEMLARKFPEVVERLKRHLADRKVELIGGTYGQPMGTMFSGESNIRQIVLGREAIRKALGYEMVTFLDEEEFTHPQLPQILAAAGYRYASLSQWDTWGRAGCPLMDQSAIIWKGIDGTALPAIPKTVLCVSGDWDWMPFISPAVLRKLQARGMPLLMPWQEFGWESPEQPAYLTVPAQFQAVAAKVPVEFVTCRRVSGEVRPGPRGHDLPADGRLEQAVDVGHWRRPVADSRPQGGRAAPGGGVLRRGRFDVGLSRPRPSCWKRHGRTCWPPRATTWGCANTHAGRPTRWSPWKSPRTIPTSPGAHSETTSSTGPENRGKRRWALPGRHRQANRLEGGPARFDGGHRVQLLRLAAKGPGSDRADFPHCRKGGGRGRQGPRRPRPPFPDCQGRPRPARKSRDGLDRLPRRRSSRRRIRDVLLGVYAAGGRSRGGWGAGRPVPPDARERARPGAARPVDGRNRQPDLQAVGRETLDGAKAPFPAFNGRPNPALPLRPNPPASYDSSKSKARIDWLENGPVRATVRAQHEWKYLKFETRVTVTAGLPYVEVLSRILAFVPPQRDARPRKEIKEGYWFSRPRLSGRPA